MAEIPMLFSTPMVQAIQENRKSMTRRVIKPQPDEKYNYCHGICTSSTDNKNVGRVGFGPSEVLVKQFVKPLWRPGDRPWVRETWQCIKYDSMDGDLSYGVEFKDGTRKHFEFDDNERFHQFGKYAFKGGWQQSIYMPKEAARIWLEVTDVRVERLQEITVEDVISEGLEADNEIRNPDPSTHESIKSWNLAWAQYVFRELWDSINLKHGYGWGMNPWVWVISFRRMETCD